MTKGNFHGSFDPIVYNEFQRMVGKGNVTKKIEDFMRSFNAQASNDIDAVNIELLAVEVNNLRNQKMKIDSSLNQKITLLDQIKEKRDKDTQEMLTKEKERIEKANSCKQCGNPINTQLKNHKFGEDWVCNSCFLGTPKEARRWKI